MVKKKRLKFSIVTNEMPDDVYKLFEKKTETKSLTSYVIKLVQQDLANTAVQHDLASIFTKLEELNNKVDAIERIEVGVHEKPQQTAAATSLVDFEPADEIVGSIEEDTDLDF